MRKKKEQVKEEVVELLDSDSDDDFEWVEPKPEKPSRSSKKEVKKKGKGSDRKEDNKKKVHVNPAAEYVVELSKSSRAECKRCHEKIGKNEVRVGVVVQGDRWLSTNWQHLSCTIFPPNVQVAEGLNGYNELPSDEKKLVGERISGSVDEVDPDYIPVDPNELVRTTWREEMEPENELLMPLLPYQKEGLGWMVHQEQSDARGGILADEMGMGKTIQAISLILANQPKVNSATQQKLRLKSEDEHRLLMKGTAQETKSGRPTSRGKTLVIVPTVALRQWQSEIFRFTRSGALNVVAYHGPARGDITQRMLMKADVVVTTFKILEVEFRNATALTKMPCSICGKKYYPDKYRLHRKYYCGDDSKKTEAQSKTMRKRDGQRGGASGVVSLDDSSSEYSEEDEIDRQKKIIRAMKEDRKKDTSKRKKLSRKKSDLHSSGSEVDESDYQQRKIMRAGSEGTKNNANIKIGQRKKPTSRTNKAANDASSSEDEIDRQKRMIKEMKERETTNNNQKKANGRGQTGKTSRSVKTAPVRSRGRKPSKKVSDGSDSDYQADTTTENDSDDSNFSACASGAGKNNKRKRSISTSKGARKTYELPASSRRKKGGYGVGEDSDSDDDDLNPIVEREIEMALRRSTKSVVPSLLHTICWFRIILDEAHMIKDRSSSTAKAVFHLASLYKWCLTGTPLQNRVGELYSLVRFLRLDPHAYYYCRTKGCDCKSLHYKFTKGRCDECSHTAMQHFSFFNKHILNPIQRSGYVGPGRQGMLTLKNDILDQVLLRRTKDTRAEDIQLPPRVVKVRLDSLDAYEEDFYEAMYTQSQAQFNTYVQAGTILNNYAHIFDILIRLRQVVDHPYLVLHSNDNNKRAQANGLKTLAELDRDLQSTESSSKNVRSRRSSRLVGNDTDQETNSGNSEPTLCGFCHEPPSSPMKARCGHLFCQGCVTDYLQLLEDAGEQNGVSSPAQCPLCEEPLSLIFSEQAVSAAHDAVYFPPTSQGRKSFVNRLDLSNFQSSTKLEALMQELHAMRSRDLGAKAIVFSQFVNMLDLTEYRLQRGGLNCGKLTGSLTVDQREKVLQAFNNDPDVNVLLISLKAGGVALNLTAANHIFIMDPWWNPAAEMQAIDRTHRIGQHKPIFATRFIVENTIEERILHLQEKKRLVFDGTIGGDAGSMARLNVEDMRFLFQ